MMTLNEMTLEERIILYANGDEENEIPAHGFDFSPEDLATIMRSVLLVQRLKRTDFVHNYQWERFDIREACETLNRLIKDARMIGEVNDGVN